MKTLMKQLATVTFLAVLLLAGNYNAKAIDVKASVQTNSETTLQLENWMVNETIWNTSKTAVDLNEETDASLQLENWMTNEQAWTTTAPVAAEHEPALKLESWMISNNLWK